MNKFNFSDNLANNASVIIITSFIIIAFLAITFFWPGFQELNILRKNIEQKRIELQGKKNYVTRLNQAKIRLEEQSGDFSKVKSALPQDPSLPSVFNYLQAVSAESGLVLETISSFSISSSKDLPDLKETVFSINVAGSYPSLKHFLSVVERSARLIEIENISFASLDQTQQEEDEVFSFTLQMKVFSY